MADIQISEIWSSRLGKELSELTKNDDPSSSAQRLLPPFISFQNHQMVIQDGICKVDFIIRVESQADESDEPLVVTMDASLTKKPDGSIDVIEGAYPMRIPLPLLKTGATRFPEGSTIQNGDSMELDCDWNPSLHLIDAVLNVGLKIKESILQDEPFHPSSSFSASSFSIPASDEAAGAKPPEGEAEPIDEILQGALRLGNYLQKSAKQLVDATNDVAPSTPTRKKKSPKKNKTRKSSRVTKVDIDDVINLTESPWADCRGLYSCKAVQRPPHVEELIKSAAMERRRKLESIPSSGELDEEGEVPDDFGDYMRLQAGSISKVAGAGLAGAAGMFRSLTQSAKSVLEESFLMITDDHIIELRSNKLNLTHGTVTFAISIDKMAKLKFRRQESVSLFFKSSPEQPLVYMCPDSANAVQQIQTVLKKRGVKGKHTSAITQQSIHEALQLVQEIQAKERALEYQPSVERVNQIMDLYRQTAERFASAGDVRHEEVMSHMKKFLAKPLTASILDGSFKAEAVEEPQARDSTAVPEGEVLERTNSQLDDYDNDRPSSSVEDRAFEQDIDSMLEEAKQDFAAINIDDAYLEGNDGSIDSGVADISTMLKTADKELSEIMAL